MKRNSFTRVKEATHQFTGILALVLIIPLILAACGGSDPGTPQQTAGPVTLTFGWWSNTPAKDDSMKAWIKEFESSHPNIKIKPEIIPWGNYWDKLKTTTAGGNAYDIIGFCSCTAAQYYDSGALLDLKTFSDYDDSIKNLTDGPLKLTLWDDKAYGLPLGTSVSVLGYNRAILKAAGVPDPDPVTPMTFEQFKEIAKKIKNINDGKGPYYALNPLDIVDFDTAVRLEGGQTYDNPVNPTKVTVNTPEGIAGLKAYKSLFDDGIVPPLQELTSGPWSFDYGALETKKIGFARVGAWLFADMQKNPDYGIAPLYTSKKTLVTGTVNSLAIYKGSKFANQAWEFIKWSTQTTAQVGFAKFSDVPAEKEAQAKMDTYIEPKAFAPTLNAALPTFEPALMTHKTEFQSVLSTIVTDMVLGKITPEDAAAKMEQEGNAVLAAA